MIIFPGLRTKRLAVTLREITLGEAIAVCRLPADRNEATTTEFLRRVADGAQAPTKAYVTDPRLWTVEERTRLVCHYLSQVSSSGADFAVGDGKLSDYLRFTADLSAAEVPLGDVAGKARVLRPLLGVHVEMLERFCTSRGDWLHGMIACQIHEADQPEPDYLAFTDIQLIEWGRARFDSLRKLPESDFEELYAAWVEGRRAIEHFFVTAVDDEGVVFFPQDMTEAGPKTPVRFLALPCISKGTRELFAGPDQSGR
jgi:hypothetical protein